MQNVGNLSRRVNLDEKSQNFFIKIVKLQECVDYYNRKIKSMSSTYYIKLEIQNT